MNKFIAGIFFSMIFWSIAFVGTKNFLVKQEEEITLAQKQKLSVVSLVDGKEKKDDSCVVYIKGKF